MIFTSSLLFKEEVEFISKDIFSNPDYSDIILDFNKKTGL